jgi:hypothetical protein
MKENYRPGFIYTVEHIGVDGKIKSVEKIHNLMPTPAVDYLLNAAFMGGSAYSTWYLSLFDNNRTPLAADTMTTFLADCGEDTVYTAVGGARPTISFPPVSAGVLTTVASPNELAFASPSTVRGAFVTTGVTRGGTTGLLCSAVLFSTAKVLAAGESLRVPVGFALISA